MTAGDGEGSGGGEQVSTESSGVLAIRTASPTWLTAAPSGPGRAPGAFEAEARLVVRSSELLYRALRTDEVRYEEGVAVGLKGGKLVPRQRASDMSMQRAVEEGSTVHASKYVHVTADVTAAVYFARSGSGLVAVLDRKRLEDTGMRLLDLSKEAVRHGGGVQPGSTAEAMAIAAAEWLIDEAEVDEEMLVGELLDVRRLAERPRASSIASAIEVMEDKDKVWLAKEVYDRLDMVERTGSGASGQRRKLALVTDASVQLPLPGLTAACVRAVAGRAETAAGSRLMGDSLRWKLLDTGRWELEAKIKEGEWRRVEIDGTPVRPGGAGAAKEARGTARLMKTTAGVAHEPAEQARAASDEATDGTLHALLARLVELPEERRDAATFVETGLRKLAETKAGASPRQWKTRLAGAGGDKLTAVQWQAVEAAGEAAGEAAEQGEAVENARPLTATMYAAASEAARLERWPHVWAALGGGENGEACACVRGGDCEWTQKEGVSGGTEYKRQLQAVTGLEKGSWRRNKRHKGDGAREAQTEGEEGEDEDETEPKAGYFCMCGEESATPLERAMHWELQALDGRPHGLPPDERKRLGAAWVLLDVATGRVLRGGCERMPATGEANDYSTKAEGQTIALALRDVLPGLPLGTEVRVHTDSASWVASWNVVQGGRLKMRRELRKPDMSALHAALQEVGSGAQRGVTIVGAEWQPAEHNLPKADERRAHALSRANRAVDAGAGRSAEGGRDEEIAYLQTHTPEKSTPLEF